MSLQLHPALRAFGVGVGGLVLLVGGSLAAYSGLKSLAQAGTPAPPAPPASTAAKQPAQGADPAATLRRAHLLAKKSHGDWTLLSVDDQRLLNSVTGGHGRDLLHSMARERSAGKPRRIE